MSVENKICLLIEESNNKLFEKAYEYIFGKYFKMLDKEEFNTLLDIINQWFYFNKDFKVIIKKTKAKKVINKINSHSINTPKKLYRGVRFDSKKKRDNYIENISKSNMTHEDYTSWSSSKKIAEQFVPGGKYDQGMKHGVMLEVNGNDIKSNIRFSLTNLISNEKDKKEFFNLVLKEHHNKLKQGLSSKNIKTYIAKNDLFGDMHGSIYAIIEDEYVVDSFEKIKNIKITKIDTK